MEKVMFGDVNIIKFLFRLSGGYGCIYSLVCKRWYEIIISYEISRSTDALLKRGEVDIYLNMRLNHFLPVNRTYLFHRKFLLEFYDYYFLIDREIDDRFLNCVKNNNFSSVEFFYEKGYYPDHDLTIQTLIVSIRNRSIEMINMIASKAVPQVADEICFEEAVKVDDVDVLLTVLDTMKPILHETQEDIVNRNVLIFRYLSYENIRKFYRLVSMFISTDVYLRCLNQTVIIEAIKRRNEQIIQLLYNNNLVALSTSNQKELKDQGYELGPFDDNIEVPSMIIDIDSDSDL